MHFDYGHACLTFTIDLAKRLSWQRLFHLTFLYFSLPLLFVFFTRYRCSCYERCFEKMDQMWSDYHFLIFLRILVHWINAKEFSEDSWEMTVGFFRTILHGNLARSREYEQYRNQKQRQQKGDETKFVMRWQKNKSDRIFFLRKGTVFDTGDEEWGFRREGREESHLTCLWPGESHPSKPRKLTTSHPFLPILHHHLVTHTVPLLSAKFLVCVTSG